MNGKGVVITAPEVIESGSSATRRGFIAISALTGAAAFLSACGGDGSPSSETSEFGDGDAGVLNYLLTVEHTEAAFYTAANRSGLLKGSRWASSRETFSRFEEEEAEHVSTLAEAVERLDGKPVGKPRTEFQFDTDQSVLTLASSLENLSAAAHLGQIPIIENPKALATVLSIHSVEGRHATAMNELAAEPLTPDGAFAKPASATEVLKSLEPFLIS
jgi:rubrerythrin